MRILHLYKTYPPVRGGIEHHVRVLAEAAAARGDEVTVLVTGPGRRTARARAGGVTVVRAARWLEVASAPIGPALFAEARRLGRAADLVHLHAPYPPGEVAHLVGGARAPTVLTHHSDIVRQRRLARLYAPLHRRVLARADRIVVTSARYRDSSPALEPVRAKCVVIPLGVAVERFAGAGAARVAALRRALGGRPDVTLVLAVGRLRYYKGLDVLLRALPAAPSARLVVVGTGPMEAAWRALAAGLGLGDRVRFAGEVDDDALALHYRAADVFALPANARAEAFGTVLLEAMAAGLPCVTTEVGTATSWVVQDGVTGLVVPPNDPAALARALADLGADPARRRRLGAAGAARVRAEFDERRMVGAVLALYDEIASARTPPSALAP